MKIPTIPGFDPDAFQKYSKNAGWLMFGKILSMIVAFLIARFLGPNDFGDLTFAIAFTSIILAIGTLGLDSFIIREILHDPRHRDEILGTSFWMRISVSVLLVPAAVAAYLISRNFSDQPGDEVTLMIALCASASVFKAFNIIDSYFQSQVQSKYVVYVQNICLIISSGIKIYFVLLKLPVVWFAVALLVDGLMLAIGLIMIYHRQQLNVRNWKFNTARAKSLIRLSWPLILSAVMISLYKDISTVLMKTAGSTQVGIYGAAQKISEAWYFIPVAIISSVFPAMIHARKTDVRRFTKRLQNLYDLLVGISLPVALLISFSGNYIIDLVVGSDYEGAGIILSIHIWSGVFVFLGSASSQYLLAEGYTMISFYRTAAGALTNIVLSVLWIPLYGGTGAAYATLIAYFVATFSILLVPQTRQQGFMMLRSLFLISIISKLTSRKTNEA